MTDKHSWTSASRPMLPASTFLHQSPIPEHSITGLGPLIPEPGCSRHRHLIHAGTGVTGCRTVRHSGILKHCVKVKKYKPCKFSLLTVKRDTPCRPYSRRWKGIHLAVERDTPSCTSTYTAADDERYALYVHIAGDGYTLHVFIAGGRNWICLSHPHCKRWTRIHPIVHTSGCGKDKTPTSTLLTVDKDTP